MKKMIFPLILLAGGLTLLYFYSHQITESGQSVENINQPQGKIEIQDDQSGELPEQVGLAEQEESDADFIEAYWTYPIATKGDAPHTWSALEKNLKPEACAQCHVEQFDAWKKSLHAGAYSPGLIGQFPGMGHGEGNDCLKCHAPLAEQKYISNQDMLSSLKTKLQHPMGFSEKGELSKSGLPLRHAGVTCAACHVRGWQRFGPPQRNTGKTGKVKVDAHDGFTGIKGFEESNFCASCHQFPQSYAINGKPLENTVKEWKESRFAREGVHCQNCHMPDRKHEFRGIHDLEMTKKGLDFTLEKKGGGALLRIHSKWIGHAFPTYVTPKVVVLAEAIDHEGNILKTWQWEIIREVYFDEGWKEKRDTRLMPDETRDFEISEVPAKTDQVHYRVNVIPDHFYKGIYEGLLHDDLEVDAETLIRQAIDQAESNDYTLYEKSVRL